MVDVLQSQSGASSHSTPVCIFAPKTVTLAIFDHKKQSVNSCARPRRSTAVNRPACYAAEIHMEGDAAEAHMEGDEHEVSVAAHVSHPCFSDYTDTVCCARLVRVVCYAV